MSRQAVRSEITAALQAWAISAGVVFVQTINLANSTTAEAWCTVEFFSDFTQSECFDGSDRVESGTFDVTIFVKAGTGDAAAVNLCDHLQDHLWLGHLPSNLEITDTVSASEINAGDSSGLFAGWTVSFDYNHYYHVA